MSWVSPFPVNEDNSRLHALCVLFRALGKGCCGEEDALVSLHPLKCTDEPLNGRAPNSLPGIVPLGLYVDA